MTFSGGDKATFHQPMQEIEYQRLLNEFYEEATPHCMTPTYIFIYILTYNISLDSSRMGLLIHSYRAEFGILSERALISH